MMDGSTAMSHAVAIGNHTAMQTMFVMGSKKSGFDHYSTGGFNLLDTESSQALAKGEYPENEPARLDKEGEKAATNFLTAAYASNDIDTLRVLVGFGVDVNHHNQEYLGILALGTALGRSDDSKEC